jgi:hypothetical protein
MRKFRTDLVQIYEEVHKYFVIYEKAVSLCTRSFLKFLIYEENLIFFFISVPVFSISNPVVKAH